MSTKNRYENLVDVQRERARQIQLKKKEADRISAELDALNTLQQAEIDEFINPRLRYLAKVGRSVLGKCWGVGNEVLPKHANGMTLWTLYDFKVTKVTPENIYLEGKRGTHEKLFVLSRDQFLHLSDRDFAKMIRSRMPGRKKRQREWDSKNALASISKLKSEIFAREWDIRKLEALVIKPEVV